MFSTCWALLGSNVGRMIAKCIRHLTCIISYRTKIKFILKVSRMWESKSSRNVPEFCVRTFFFYIFSTTFSDCVTSENHVTFSVLNKNEVELRQRVRKMDVQQGEKNNIVYNKRIKQHALDTDSPHWHPPAPYTSLIPASHSKLHLVCFLLLWREGSRRARGKMHTWHMNVWRQQ